MYEIASTFEFGAMDLAEKKAWLTKAVASECLEAKYRVAMFYFRRRIYRTEAFDLIRKAAQNGHAKSAYQLASCYLAPLNDPATPYIPLGDAEWQVFNFIELMLTKPQWSDELKKRYRKELIQQQQMAPH